MKNTSIIVLIMMLFTGSISFSQVGIGTATPHQSSILHLESTDKGLLLPRLTSSQRNNISSPAPGLMIYNTTTLCLNIRLDFRWIEVCDESDWPFEYVHTDGIVTEIVDVVNPVTGRTWMDRNLGALRVANAFNDSEAYGDLFQWGRFADGHQSRTSSLTAVQSAVDFPGHSRFITMPAGLGRDWRNPSNDFLWTFPPDPEGTNPCPQGYYVPTQALWAAEMATWGSLNRAGAFNSLLKLPAAGSRDHVDGTISFAGTLGSYWAATIGMWGSIYLFFDGGTADVTNSAGRAYGSSVRCTKF